MGRIIINNKSDLSDMDAVIFTVKVMQSGRISNNGKQYCYLSSFNSNGNEYHIVTDLREKSDSFTIYKVAFEKGEIKLA